MRQDRPSSTATLIAAATVFLDGDPRVRGLVPAGAATLCRRFISSSPMPTRAVIGALCHPALRWLARLAERSTVPGLMLHFMLRKRMIESAVTEAARRVFPGCVIVQYVMYPIREKPVSPTRAGSTIPCFVKASTTASMRATNRGPSLTYRELASASGKSLS